VFVHGNPGSSQDWARLVERTGRLARAVAWDHPGFGQADKPAGFHHTVQGYAAHLLDPTAECGPPSRCQATDPGMPGCSGWPMPSPPAGGSGPWKARAGMGPG
jgi:pimeloyl-ACP methyl ester carboxylesterase